MDYLQYRLLAISSKWRWDGSWKGGGGGSREVTKPTLTTQLNTEDAL